VERRIKSGDDGLGRRAILLTAALLPGCTLVDQTTFNPNAGKRPDIPRPPPPPPVPPPPDPAALVTIRLPYAGDLRGTIASAVAAARARKRDVAFDVVEVTNAPPDANPGAEAAEVARIITAQGVPASRVRLMVRPTPEPRREVRVYAH
jgi:hypothetical protein